MDQNQTVDNDLQKAIDNITNTTNADPVFSDPIAAPSTISEEYVEELNNPVEPISEPTAVQNQDPIAPFEPINIPELNTQEGSNPSTIQETPTAPETPNLNTATLNSTETIAQPPQEPAPIPETIAPQLSPETAPITPESTTVASSAPITAPESTPNATSNLSPSLNARQIKESALRDLVPLLDRINITPSQKFNICRNVFKDLRDYTVLDQAYRAASGIPDDTERAEALLFLVEAIDKM